MSRPGFSGISKVNVPICAQISYGDVSVMIHNCAGKILVQENIKIEEYARNEVRLNYDYIQLFSFTSTSRGKLRLDPVSC